MFVERALWWFMVFGFFFIVAAFNGFCLVFGILRLNCWWSSMVLGDFRCFWKWRLEGHLSPFLVTC